MVNFQTYLEDQRVDEAIKRKAVVRNKKKVWKFKSTRPGKYRIEIDPITKKPKEVRMTATERRKRRLGQKKGKIKRKSKIKGIELKRKRSFIMRKNIGLKYNKKIPDKVLNRKPYVPKQETGKKDGFFMKIIKKIGKLLRPKNESILDYLDDNLLLESPHTFLDDEYEVCWDFYEELDPLNWMEQLVTLYRDHYMDSMIDNGNNEIIHVDFEPEEINTITDNLIYNIEFVNIAREDIKDISDNLRRDLMKYVPAKLLSKIMDIGR